MENSGLAFKKLRKNFLRSLYWQWSHIANSIYTFCVFILELMHPSAINDLNIIVRRYVNTTPVSFSLMGVHNKACHSSEYCLAFILEQLRLILDIRSHKTFSTFTYSN